MKLEVIEEFTLREFDKLRDIKRKDKDEKGKLFLGDTFECDEDMVKYLLGDNPLKKAVVKIVETKTLKSETKPVLKEENIKPLVKEKLEKTFDTIAEVLNKPIEVVETTDEENTKTKQPKKKRNEE